MDKCVNCETRTEPMKCEKHSCCKMFQKMCEKMYKSFVLNYLEDTCNKYSKGLISNEEFISDVISYVRKEVEHDRTL